MSYTTTIPAGKIDEADLIALAEQVTAITKSPIKIETQLVVTTEDVYVSSMLDSLMDSLEAQPAGKKNGKTKVTKKAGKGNGTMTSHQVRIEETGEILSRQAFNKRLEAGDVAELTNVTNAKGEAFVVIDRKLVKGPQS